MYYKEINAKMYQFNTKIGALYLFNSFLQYIMPFYHKLGKIPPKRHTQGRKKDGKLYYEQLFGTIWF